MSTSGDIEDEEDDVEFVSEGPLRPVLECIDLLSDGEDDAGVCTIEDQVDKQKAHAASTLDRLARQVAAEKQERAEKCKAFKEKMISLQAHGRQELAVSHCSGGESNDAKRCVDIWLKMPGLKPGVLHTGTSWRRRSALASSFKSSPQTCPVVNCGRVYDNVPLLEGHLKRFDHSPCDPTIMLKGHSTPVYACVACGQHFDTKESWRTHMDSKLSSSDARGHVSSQTCQLIVCFACPACYLLFNIRDECLQHMAARNHFTQSISLSDVKSSAVPIPVPRYVKARLIALCKDVAFNVKCTACSKVLTSHMEAKAHFNVHCRHGCAIAEADQTVTQIMKQMTVLGQCSSCAKTFLRRRLIEEHRVQTQHEVEMIGSMEKALLCYSNYCEIRHGVKDASSHLSKRVGATEDSSHRDRRGKNESPAKRQRLSGSSSQADCERTLNLAWFCECGLRFLEEDQTNKHLLAANQIFHKCAVCGKLMSESSVARLHMSRFHGGAHLSNFLFFCRLCKIEMPRMEDILSHVGVAHQGHRYYEEREDAVEKISAGPSPKPSTSAAESRPIVNSHVRPRKREERWLCRMCEDLFDSEAVVHKHCSDVNSHSFQRFACGHCPQKFFKESTLRRHCANEHDGQLLLRYFCGLCDSMLYESEQEFQEHYVSLHSKDYYCLDKMENGSDPIPDSSVEMPTTSKSVAQLCPCMSFQKGNDEKKSTFTRCMKQLASEDKCIYVCHRCTVKVCSYAEMKTHMYLKHKAPGKDKSFDVVCMSCSKSHRDVPSFHSHYHEHHCLLEPCVSSRTNGTEKVVTLPKVMKAEEISDRNAEEFQEVKSAIASSIDVSKEDPEDCKGNHDDFDEEVKLALALSAEEAKKPTEFDRDMEEALKRSLQDF
ncbi:E3 SUMO-protein ligase ZNF451 isoform X1 [Pygocentrus nattereri]|uniref:E3 SUMO-protein ligase ZNF451 isoform X1 n=1 Tax=Pygocentrus nattereri TaxID=42514 RepID=UPI00081453CB|nr:E3 SUMO-protein ligase ZNF451 isoform X1 [Pygocentrus nattereri]XP_017549612.1 E3 SUMO-protein ligase ZNF451 isoform X1 [Pygocentrus nattereri]